MRRLFLVQSHSCACLRAVSNRPPKTVSGPWVQFKPSVQGVVKRQPEEMENVCRVPLLLTGVSKETHPAWTVPLTLSLTCDGLWGRSGNLTPSHLSHPLNVDREELVSAYIRKRIESLRRYNRPVPSVPDISSYRGASNRSGRVFCRCSHA